MKLRGKREPKMTEQRAQEMCDENVRRGYFKKNPNGTYSMTERGSGDVEGMAAARGVDLEKLKGASLYEFMAALGMS